MLFNLGKTRLARLRSAVEKMRFLLCPLWQWERPKLFSRIKRNEVPAVFGICKKTIMGANMSLPETALEIKSDMPIKPK
jgi:hypothetical protein